MTRLISDRLNHKLLKLQTTSIILTLFSSAQLLYYFQFSISDLGDVDSFIGRVWIGFWVFLALFFIARVVRKWRKLGGIQQKEWLEQKIQERTEELYDRKVEINAKNELLEQKQKEIEQQNIKLQQLNGSLEEMVSQRTAQLQKALDKVLHSTRELDNFIYKAPHDFRGPIARLLGLVRLAKMDATSEGTIDYLDMIELTASRMDLMLSKLMKVYDLERAKLKLEPLDLEVLAQQVYSKLANQLKIEGTHLLIENNLENAFWGDLICLETILANLLDNALLYSVKSQRTVEIKLSLISLEEGIELTVSDKGMGINPEIEAYITEPFFKGTDRSDGNGLGLFLVQRAVEKLEGDLSFLSDSSVGTVFKVRLPNLHEP